MPKYVAFLRAINVGGHVVKMDQLKQLFIDAGFANVETFIASGNVIFESKSKNIESIEKKLEKYLELKLGYAVSTFVRSLDEVVEIASYAPFKADGDGERIFIGFLAGKLEPSAVEKMQASSTDTDLFHIRDRELFWLCRTSLTDSKFFGPLLEKTLGARTTLRNSNTVKRIVAKYS
ncbi:MAG TPA: DUF1697 domain-containing protein [Pyrinomonadaceae bacterium]|jgi:uncharacterized protein (DUF1697 family)|nr:DUF1697 domain-containing protein [Pyrinomonadaceae bacterium]